MTKSVISFIVAATFSLNTYAQTNIIENRFWVHDWTVNGVANTLIVFVDSNNTIQFERWTTEISTSRSGETRIYFTVHPNVTTCNVDSLPKILVIDDREVAVHSFCNSYSDSDNYYYSFTPRTQDGLNYVVSVFRNKPDGERVIVNYGSQLNNIIKEFSAKGFTKAYDLNRVL